METPTSFDLNRAIQQWREDLAQSPSFRGENLAELEAHLRDSVAALETRGLTKEEAFVVACKRIGKGGALEKEFRKVNGHAIWLDRLLWMAIGFQFWMIVWIAYSATQTIVHAVMWWTVEGTIVSPLGFKMEASLLPPVLFALVLFLGWRLLRRRVDQVRDLFAGLLVKPLRLALAFFLVAVCLGLLADGVRLYWIEPALYKATPTLDWIYFLIKVDSLLPHAVGAMFIWILARKRLRSRIA